MSDRERWIVYPLLFLAIGLSLRTKAFVETGQIKVNQVVDAEQINCRRLIVQNEKGEPLMGLGSSTDGSTGVIQVKRGIMTFEGRVFANQMNCNELGVIGGKGERVMTLSPLYAKKTPEGAVELQGGQIVVLDGKDKKQVVVSVTADGGIVAVLDHAGNHVDLSHVQTKADKRLAGLFATDQEGNVQKLVSVEFKPHDDQEKPTNPQGKPEKPEERKKPDEPKKPAPTDVSDKRSAISSQRSEK
jgi:hypothetical protein